MIQGYANLKIQAPDKEKDIAFYTQALQMPLIGEDTVTFPEGTTVTVNKGEEASANTSGFTHICIDTCNADDGWARALKCGCIPSRESDVPTGDNELYGGFLRNAGDEEIKLWHICKNGQQSEPYETGNFVKAFVHAAVTRRIWTKRSVSMKRSVSA